MENKHCYTCYGSNACLSLIIHGQFAFLLPAMWTTFVSTAKSKCITILRVALSDTNVHDFALQMNNKLNLSFWIKVLEWNDIFLVLSVVPLDLISVIHGITNLSHNEQN